MLELLLADYLSANFQSKISGLLALARTNSLTAARYAAYHI